MSYFIKLFLKMLKVRGRNTMEHLAADTAKRVTLVSWTICSGEKIWWFVWSLAANEVQSATGILSQERAQLLTGELVLGFTHSQCWYDTNERGRSFTWTWVTRWTTSDITQLCCGCEASEAWLHADSWNSIIRICSLHHQLFLKWSPLAHVQSASPPLISERRIKTPNFRARLRCSVDYSVSGSALGPESSLPALTLNSGAQQ